MAYKHKMHLNLKKGGFHEWLGKSKDEPITEADILKGKRAGGHAEKMAVMAENMSHWHHKGRHKHDK